MSKGFPKKKKCYKHRGLLVTSESGNAQESEEIMRRTHGKTYSGSCTEAWGGEGARRAHAAAVQLAPGLAVGPGGPWLI